MTSSLTDRHNITGAQQEGLEYKVSVIVPVYNVAQYLCECLDSILGQTYSNLEVIVVNDGSTDNSSAICERYASQDARIKLINKENGGLSSARNAGMDVMTGDLISFVDSDDYILPDMIERCVNAFQNHPEVGVVRFAFDEFYEDGRVYQVSSVNVGDRPLPLNDAFKWFAKGEVAHCVWSAVYHKDLVKDYRYVPGIYAEDLHFTLTLYRDKEFSTVFIPDTLYRYRVNSQSISQSKYKAMMLDAFKLWEEGVERMKLQDPKRASQIVYLLFHHMRVLENKHRFARTQGEELKMLQELFAPYYRLIRHNRIDWSLSPSPIRHFLYWYFPKLFRLLRPSDWGVESIRR